MARIITPTCYSKSQTREKLREILKAAPKQVSNTPEAMKGLVAEFNVPGMGSAVGTLSELGKHLKETRFIVKFKCGRTLNVTCDKEGNWTQRA